MAATCKTCRWWKLYDAEEASIGPPDYDYAVIAAKPCSCPKIRDMSVLDDGLWCGLASDAAGYSDREEYGAYFRTGPDFGCIHHEVTEEKPDGSK